MATHAAFLRGINVTGMRMTSDTLRAPFEDLGFEDVATFRASGNVVFSAGGPGDPTERVEKALRDAFGREVAAFLRTAEQVRAIAAFEPFPARVVTASEGKLQVVFLRGPLDVGDRGALLALSTEDDRLAVEGSEVYWLPARGIARSELGMKGFDRVGVNTIRTMGTIEQLASKFFS